MADEDKEIQQALIEANRKNRKSGGFQVMGLSQTLFKAIMHKGYKVPTPVQRKCIPMILDGKDVVGMARTGSGKTGAFLIPMVEKLKAHSAQVGIRGLVLSPSRELALQTLKFAKDFCKYTDLRCCVLVGGDSMDEHVIATPGRLLHLMVEMELSLSRLEYVVFDEADRLFEMGFAIQLHEIMHRMPENRQTLLFSATLPKTLVDFAKAGLNEPTLVRLDVETKISEDLEMGFFAVKAIDKIGALLFILRNIVSNKKGQTIIFVSTKHHVEYLYQIMTQAGFRASYIYGALDQTARKIQIASFRSGRNPILIVTDVAARGIDIPLLDNVINFDFPSQSKIFVHRVGRTARAGKRGWAYSLVSFDELPFLLDLQLFLSRDFVAVPCNLSEAEDYSYTRQIVFGTIPQNALEVDNEHVATLHSNDIQLEALKKVAENGYKQYVRSRPAASSESYKRAKELQMDASSFDGTGIHPLVVPHLAGKMDQVSSQLDLLTKISQYRPTETIFEIRASSRNVKSNSTQIELMQNRRAKVQGKITTTRELIQERVEKKRKLLVESSEARKSFKDDSFYIDYFNRDANTEKGYAITNDSFNAQAQAALLALPAEDGSREVTDPNQEHRPKQVWDRKNNRFITPALGSDNKKMIKGESGVKLPATYKTDRFKQWAKKNKIVVPRAGEQELAGSSSKAQGKLFNSQRFRHYTKGKNEEESKNELKSMDQIKKSRKMKEKRLAKTGRHDAGKGNGKGKPRGKPTGKPRGKPIGKPHGKPTGKLHGKSAGKPTGKPFGKGKKGRK